MGTKSASIEEDSVVERVGKEERVDMVMLMMITTDLVFMDLMMIFSKVLMMIYTLEDTTEEDSVDTMEEDSVERVDTEERVERADTEEREEKEERADTTAVVATKCVKSFAKLCTTIRFLSLPVP